MTAKDSVPVVTKEPPPPPNYRDELMTGGPNMCLYCGSLLENPCTTPPLDKACTKALVAKYSNLLMEKHNALSKPR